MTHGTSSAALASVGWDAGVQVHGCSSEALRAHVDASLSAALDQHAAHVRSVELSMQDVNGHKGGVDKKVRAVVRLSRGLPVVVEELGDDLYVTVSHVAERVKQATGRRLGRGKARSA